MKTKKNLAASGLLLVLALLVSVLVVACGGGNDTQEETETTAPAETAGTDAPDAPETPAEEATPAPAEPTDPLTDTGGTAIDTPPAPDGHEPLTTEYLEFGVVPHLYYTDHERVLQLVKNAGFGWIRQQVVWKDMEMFECPEGFELQGPVCQSGDQTTTPQHRKYVWDQLDPIIEATAAYDLKILISVVQSPAPYNPQHGLPQDPVTLGNFVAAMAERYGNQIQAYEIWNEQNLAHETGGRIVPEDAGRYVEILKESYQRIKAINPDAYVLAGAPSTTGFTREDVALSDLEYYRAMYSYQDGIVRDYFDIQAVHPSGSANPPDTLWPDNPSTAEGWTEDSTFYFRHIEHVRDIMVEYGMGDHQMWITEYGWATENTTPGYEFGNQVSFEQQAEYITGAIRYTYENYPWVSNMFLWNMNFAVTWNEHLAFLQQRGDLTPEEQEMINLYWNEADPGKPLHEQASFGILAGNWEPRPSFHAVQQTMAEIKAEQGR